MAESGGPEQPDPKTVNRKAYNSMAETYLDWTNDNPSPRAMYLNKLFKVIKDPLQASVLDLGCGPGISTKFLAERCAQVIANDISATQIQFASKTVARDNTTFLTSDMLSLELEPSSLQAVVSFYAIIHLPRDEQRVVFKKIFTWLSPGGHLLCNLSTTDMPGTFDEFLGATMFWSGYDAKINSNVLTNIGFVLFEDKIVEDDEDGKLVPFQWILAMKP